MRALLPLLPSLLLPAAVLAQDLYFPPTVGNTWETTDPAELGWCPERIDSLQAYVGAHHTKAFLVLKEGRIVLEWYFGTFTQDSLWYWASAGKTLTSTLVGIAQEEGYLHLTDPTDQYLGAGWTSAPPDKEALITVRNQLTMTSGLDDGVADVDCTLPSCLDYLADAGTRWAYHNAVYTLLDPVIEHATGQAFSTYFNTRLRNPIGMNGLWYSGGGYNNVYYSKARSMARYGLLALNHMVWDGDTILHDAAYFHAATTPSQDLNHSYGYLWWLNGQDSFMLPTTQFVFPGPLMPNAPPDMFSALGKNDQLLNVVPSQGLVLVRMGDPAAGSQSVSIVFNDAIWQYMNALPCSTAVPENRDDPPALAYPIPCADALHLRTAGTLRSCVLYDVMGRPVLNGTHVDVLDVAAVPGGSYLLRFEDDHGMHVVPVLKQ